MNQAKKKVFSVISVLLSLLMVISVISFPTLKAKADEPKKTVDDFVERCYTVTLDRPSEPDGFADWKDRLLNGKAVGIEVAYGFLFSPEYTKKNKSDEEYVTDLYMLFLGRLPDEGGYNDWVGQLKEGKTRLDVYAGFANSPEFYNLCSECGITAGRYVKGYDRETNNNVNLFVERLYKTCLGRIGDKEGQKNWVEKLITKQISGTECARSFIQSPEYVNKGLYDENYVKNLYLAMMGRPFDDDGYYNWMDALSNGMTRDEVFAGFANSSEFANLCAKYHIEKGSYTAKDVSKPGVTPEPSKLYRVSRIDYSNGEYVLVKYEYSDVEISKIRYDVNGNQMCYDYRDETMSNGDYYYGATEYYDDGSYFYEYHYKTTYNSDKSERTEYSYIDDWATLEYYDVYNDVEYTYTDPDETYTARHPISATCYDADGNKTGSMIYQYYSNNKQKRIIQYDDSGKMINEQQYEYYDKKGYEYQYVKKYVEIDYNYDGTVNNKNIEEYDENENQIKYSSYPDGVLSEYKVYDYDSKGNMIKSTCYTSTNEVAYYTDFEYDYYGNKIKEKNYNWGAYLGYTDYKYDSNNNLLKAVSYDNNNNVTGYTGYDYNGEGKMTGYYLYDGTDLLEEKYELDENGNKTKLSRSKNGSVYYWEKYTYEPYTEE